MDLTLLALVAAAFLLEGTVKSIVGLERPPTAMGVLVLVMSPVEAMAFLVVPSFVTNLLHAISGLHLGKLIKRFWPLLLTGSAATISGTGWLAQGNVNFAIAILGAVLAIYALIMLVRPGLSNLCAGTQRFNPVIGLLTRTATAAKSVSAVSVVPYLISTQLRVSYD